MQKLLISWFALLLLNCFPVKFNLALAQQTDSLVSQENSGSYKDAGTEEEARRRELEEDFNPGVFLFVVMLFGAILFSIGAGIVLTIAILFMVFGLVALGLFSTSVIVAMHSKSLASGFQTLVMLVTVIGGTLSGGIVFWALNKILHWSSGWVAFISGSGAGFVAGIILGYLAIYVLRRTSLYFKGRLKLT